ncbi:MFS transporter [Actinokineospora cianjurensis]|uniref:Putative MFS family arabinose efflux permease n=1 Tax=Actinokineospora cianjurensis TaxID=585224 RepID=A0A421B688_9PSEU|nr:MFS transporter [Actinokineospora cianjurensis]RLK59907.1 putative MFS family arabinose efflux permease [Actinokineospora cianjurensis]
MSQSAGLADYRAALTTPGARGPALASLLGRLPVAMVGFSMLLYIRESTGSYATASLVSAGTLIGLAIGSVGQGRIMDRIGAAIPLLVTTALFGVFVGLTLIATESGAPTALLIVLGVAVGMTEPVVASASRTMWTRVTPVGPVRDAALAYEAISMEVFFILGPAISGLLIALPWAGTGLATAAVCMIVGSVWFALTPTIRRHRPEPVAHAGLLGPLAFPGMRTLAIAAMGFGVLLGFIEVAVPAAATAAGNTPAGGLLLGLLSISSVLFGVVYGVRPWPKAMNLRLSALLAVFAVLVAVLAIPTTLVWLAVALLLVGTMVTPQATTHSAAIDLVAPPNAATEAFGWIITAVTLGLALGQLVSGQLVEHVGIWSSYLVATAAGLVFAGIVYARRATVGERVASPAQAPAMACG